MTVKLAACAPPAATLRVRALEHSFALRTVLSGIDLDVDAGRVTALVGPSGCGKTTLLHLIAGLLPIRSGQLESSFTRASCVFQQARLLPWKRTLDNIGLGLKADGLDRPQRIRRAREMALRVGLVEDDLEKFPHQLSGGMQSRVALARALVTEPDLLLMDEPFSALDIGLKHELYALLAEHLAEHGMGVLMITHDLMEALRLADTLVVMAAEPGRVMRRFRIGRAATLRDDAFIHHRCANLLEDPVVRTSFGLPLFARATQLGAMDACVGDEWERLDGEPTAVPLRRSLQC